MVNMKALPCEKSPINAFAETSCLDQRVSEKLFYFEKEELIESFELKKIPETR